MNIPNVSIHLLTLIYIIKKKKRKIFGNHKTFSYICVIVRKKDLINTDSYHVTYHRCLSTFYILFGLMPFTKP